MAVGREEMGCRWEGERCWVSRTAPTPEVRLGDLLMSVMYERALQDAWPRVALMHGVPVMEVMG